MEQTETCIPPTPYLSVNPPASRLQCGQAATGFLYLFALHRLPPSGWVKRSNPHQICLYDVF